MKKETKEIDISEIKLDLKNTNKHTQYGMGLLEKSLQKLGAGRSIVLDKDNNVICGNGVSEVNATVGLPIRIVETDGNELIAVKRMDLNITDKKAQELAIADNSIAHKNLEWDTDILSEWDSELLNEWGVELPIDNEGENIREVKLKSIYQISIDCKDEFQQKEYFEQLNNLGFKCQLLIL